MIPDNAAAILASIGPALANHLWQSTVFGATIWLMTLLLRRNHARIRYALWFAASLKFLLPFSLLIGLGTLLPQPQHVSTPSQQTMYTAIDTVGQPFSNLTPTIAPTPTTSSPKPPILPLALTAAWLCGATLLLLIWYIRWHQLSATLRISTPGHHGREHNILHRLERQTGIRKPITFKLSKDSIEPGIAGIFHPTLLWPERLSEHLEDKHIEAILAHELIHVRRRDNLTAAIHMLVEALFWFHPLVWWIEKRMLEERERACDEAVVQLGSQPGTYAESLLKACRFCLESPLPCVSGITGADLSRRVCSIMSRRLESLNVGRKIALTAFGIAAVIVPVVLGAVRIIPLHGQILHATGPVPSFEVATIKPSQLDGNNFATIRFGLDDFEAKDATAKDLIQFAYGIKSDNQIEGISGWMASRRFDINAKASEHEIAALEKLSGIERLDTFRLMAQALLADRFGIKVSQTSKEAAIYNLVVAKGGPKMKLSNVVPVNAVDNGTQQVEQRTGIRGKHGKLRGTNADTALLARVLSTESELGGTNFWGGGRLVVDKTGLTGNYDWSLEWASDSPDASRVISPDSNKPSLFTALQEQLGLKLQPSKGPVEVLVIDHIDLPSPN
jgi:bla regulator protein BlaR1